MPIQSKRHQEALDYALATIKKSPIYPYITALYLYGSCARGEEKWNSDIDLFIVLDETYKQHKELQTDLLLLKASVSTDGLYDVETDLRTVIGDNWLHADTLFYKNIRKDGILLWS